MYNAAQNALWASHTYGNSGQVELVVQDDLNAVLNLLDAAGKRVLWSTNTDNTDCPDPDRKFFFICSWLVCVVLTKLHKLCFSVL